MSTCLKCHGDGDSLPFRVLEVQTLHIRDINGEKRVQALGLFQNWAICRSCAAARLSEIRQPHRSILRRTAPYCALFLLGIVLTVAAKGAEVLALRALGPMACFCGLVGGISTVRKGLAQSRTLGALPDAEALEQAAWLCLLDAAPKKDGDNDLTYVPVNSRTLAMKNGDLMIEYDLLPAIAKKAWNLLHHVPDSEEPVQS